MQRTSPAPARVLLPAASARRRRYSATRLAPCRASLAAREQPARPLLAFTGGGIYFFWQCGCVLALQERISLRACDLTGVSAGALTATLAACDVDLRASVDLAYALTLEKDLYNRPGGLAGVWGPLINRWLHELLPTDAATICSGRVGIFTLAIWPLLPHHVFVSDFESKEDLIESAMASVHIPYFLDGHMTRRFRGKRCIDGSAVGRRDMVDTRRKQPAPGAPPTLLIDHNADPAIASNRKFGDFVELATREGLQRMVDSGYAYMRAELAAGRLDALCAAAPLPSVAGLGAR